MKWPHHPNLALRPEKPALGRGRLQEQIRRALLAADTDAVSASFVYDWCYARKRAGLSSWDRWKVSRMLSQMCERVGRAKTIGQPWLWKLRADYIIRHRGLKSLENFRQWQSCPYPVPCRRAR
jgi:hypothetical protein